MTTTTTTATTTTNKSDLLQATKKSLQALHVQRTSLEQEAAAIAAELTAGETPMGIDTPLVDANGYPRADIDVYRARSLRHRLARIRTDLQQLMRQIQQTLHQLSALQRQSSATATTGPDNNKEVAEEQAELDARRQPKPKPKYDPVSGKWVVRNWDGSIAGGAAGGSEQKFDDLHSKKNETTTTTTTAAATTEEEEAFSSLSAIRIRQQQQALPPPVPPPVLTPLARIDSVAPHSPAQRAGLQAGDLVLEFGPIRAANDNDNDDNDTDNDTDDFIMTALAQLVPRSVGQPLHIRVQRPTVLLTTGANTGTTTTTIKTLSLTPQPWSGRGLIGCHIVPYKQKKKKKEYE